MMVQEATTDEEMRIGNALIAHGGKVNKTAKACGLTEFQVQLAIYDSDYLKHCVLEGRRSVAIVDVLMHMQTVWQRNYKPQIELLLDNEREGHHAAIILACASMEHAYRAIHNIPHDCQKSGIPKESFLYIMRIWAESGGISQGEHFEFQKEHIAQEAAHAIKNHIFNKLKHAGYLHTITRGEVVKSLQAGQAYDGDDGDDIYRLHLTNDPSESYISRGSIETRITGFTDDGWVLREPEKDTLEMEYNAAYWCRCFIKGIDAAYEKAIAGTQKPQVNPHG